MIKFIKRAWCETFHKEHAGYLKYYEYKVLGFEDLNILHKKMCCRKCSREWEEFKFL